MPAQADRIIVGLFEHLGDIVACEPVARYLKINNPKAHLAWAVSKTYKSLIDSNPFIDETIVLDCLTDWIKLSAHTKDALLVDLHVNYRICQTCRIPLVKHTGNPFINCYEWLNYGSLLEVFSQGAGLPVLSGQPRVYVGEEQARSVDALGLPENYCVVHNESNISDKDWREENWIKLFDWIGANCGVKIVLVGAGKTVKEYQSEHVINLFNKLTILESAEVIRRAKFFVGIDSGPAHLANAMKIPTVLLLGQLLSFRKYNPFSGFYASDSPLVKIVRNLDGPVAGLTLEEVLEAVRYICMALTEGAETQKKADATPQPCPVDAWQRQRILDSGLFDAGWYSVVYDDVADSGLDPLEHFLTIGCAAGRCPGPEFDPQKYLEEHQDVKKAKVNPLIHYVEHGKGEGRKCFPYKPLLVAKNQGIVQPESVRVTAEMGDDLPGLTARLDDPSLFPRTFAFYLPQFHPIAENNWAHCNGFTEWQNVIKAKPMFKGHYQPKIPGELGFYDLRSTDVLQRQADLAKSHGISGFCFYYYYFSGKKLLFTPIQNFLDSDIDMPFFFLWANENWTKRWDGGDKDVIIAQQHSRTDDVVFIQQMFQYFEDKRYVRVDGKPVLMVYKHHLFPNILETTDIWRKEAERHGLPGLYLVMVDDWTPEPIYPVALGFDASYEIPSNIVPGEVVCTDTECLELEEDFCGRIIDYRKFASYHAGRVFPEYKRFRTVMLPWDNTPRYAANAMIHIHGDGEAYRLWLTQALFDTYRRYAPQERFVFLHSWNEWCEGTFLEPDGKNGRFFLDETRKAVDTVHDAIALAHSCPEAIPTIAELIKVMEMRETGAFYLTKRVHEQAQALWREVENLRGHANTLGVELQKSREYVDEVIHSRSWRFTRPLRSFMRFVRGK